MADFVDKAREEDEERLQEKVQVDDVQKDDVENDDDVRNDDIGEDDDAIENDDAVEGDDAVKDDDAANNDDDDDEEEDEDDEDEDDEDGPDVELGFFESDAEDESGDEEDARGPLVQHEEGNWLRWDDGMAGGDGPVWLVEAAREQVTKEDLACPGCASAMSFFLQVYAPLDGGEFKHAFHRTLYVFVCRKPECKAPVKVLRAQLPLVNDFYAQDCGEDEDAEIPLRIPRDNLAHGGLALGPSFPRRRRIVTEPEPAKGATRCAYCGIPATAKCVACKSVHYCSREHQKKHWPQHKPTCKILREMPEHLRAEGEGASSGSTSSSDASADVYGRSGEDDAKLTQRKLASIAAGENEQLRKKMQSYDRTFEAFQERVARDPTQCVRYCRWPASGTRKAPIWLSARDQCTEIPACEACGAPRRFEFQVLPQSLHFLRDLDMDFGTICVYTCTRSCALSSPASLAPEFAFVQHPDAHCLVADGAEGP